MEPLTFTSASLMGAIVVAMVDETRKYLEAGMLSAGNGGRSGGCLKKVGVGVGRRLGGEVKGEMSRQQQEWSGLRSKV